MISVTTTASDWYPFLASESKSFLFENTFNVKWDIQLGQFSYDTEFEYSNYRTEGSPRPLIEWKTYIVYDKRYYTWVGVWFATSSEYTTLSESVVNELIWYSGWNKVWEKL